MASSRLVPWIIAGGVGEYALGPILHLSTFVPRIIHRDRVDADYVILPTGIAGGLYIFRPSMQELSGTSPAPEPIKEGRSQSVKEDRHNDGYVIPSSSHISLAPFRTPTANCPVHTVRDYI